MCLMTNWISKMQNIKFLEEKKRFLLFVFVLLFILFLAFYLLRVAYARYEVRAKINANIDKALYIFEDDKLDFNLEPEGIIPSDEPYVYRFSVSNYNTSKHSDVDISYQVKVRTTTNLPITVSMYRNELPDAAGAANIFQSSVLEQDEDDAWYRLYSPSSEFEMNYEDDVTDIYTMVISFPSSYASDITYANYLESIEVILESKQII